MLVEGHGLHMWRRRGLLGDDQDNAYLARDGEIVASNAPDCLRNPAAVWWDICFRIIL